MLISDLITVVVVTADGIVFVVAADIVLAAVVVGSAAVGIIVTALTCN